MGDLSWRCIRCGLVSPPETGGGEYPAVCLACANDSTAAERARIVAWLRSAWTPSAEYRAILQTTAAFIERGEHVAGDGKDAGERR